YGRTNNGDKQRVWFRAAADRATATFANEAAADYYERLLPLLPEDQTAEVLVQLGTVWHLIGRWTEAEQAYHQAMELAVRTGDYAVVAASRRQLGILVMFTRSYSCASPTREGGRCPSTASPSRTSNKAYQRERWRHPSATSPSPPQPTTWP